MPDGSTSAGKYEPSRSASATGLRASAPPDSQGTVAAPGPCALQPFASDASSRAQRADSASQATAALWARVHSAASADSPTISDSKPPARRFRDRPAARAAGFQARRALLAASASPPQPCATPRGPECLASAAPTRVSRTARSSRRAAADRHRSSSWQHFSSSWPMPRPALLPDCGTLQRVAPWGHRCSAARMGRLPTAHSAAGRA